VDGAVPDAAADHAADDVQPTGDVATDAPPSPCAGAFFCDDFEGPTLDTSAWTNLNSDHGTANVEANHACSGTQSLHVTVKDGSHLGQSYQLLIAHDDPTLPADVFVRVFVSFESVPAADPVFALLGTFQAKGIQEQSIGGKLAGQSYNLAPDQSWSDKGARAIAPIECGCVEFEVNRETSTVNSWFQETSSSSTAFPPGAIPAPQRFGIGLSFFDLGGVVVTGSTDEVFLDAVALSTTRIGCRR
jgi:hypothetical protein